VSVEQVARDFVSNMNNIEKMKAMVAPDAMASGGMLPQPMPLMESMQSMAGLATAFPDLKFEVQQVTVNGNDATVKVHMSGTNTGAFDMQVPGVPTMPATGKKVSAQDAFVVTVQGDKVTAFRVDSPADGGLPAILAQMGAKMPGM
jgi:predicted ester cyclase